MKNNISYGYWITPRGKIIDVENMNSHSESLRQANLLYKIMNKSKKIHWNNTQLKNYENEDLKKIAVRLNYIRIAIFNETIFIEVKDKIDNLKSIQKKSIVKILKKDDNVKKHLFIEYSTFQTFIEYNTVQNFLNENKFCIGVFS